MKMNHPNVTISPSAKERIEQALAERGHKYFRVYIEGGGCSGYSYKFDTCLDKNDDDTTLQWERGAIAVDAATATLLEGASLDFKDELWSRQFVVTNPNARQTCGCGASFAA